MKSSQPEQEEIKNVWSGFRKYERSKTFQHPLLLRKFEIENCLFAYWSILVLWFNLYKSSVYFYNNLISVCKVGFYLGFTSTVYYFKLSALILNLNLKL